MKKLIMFFMLVLSNNLMWAIAQENLLEENTTSANYTVKQQPQQLIIGLELRTSNAECMNTIPKHWERFCKEEVFNTIPNKVGNDIFALYTDYEGDCTMPYSYIIGCEVSTLDEIPAGLVSRVVPESTYAVFTARGAFPQSVIDTWQAIWKTDLKRLYTCDFEMYRADFHPQQNSEMEVYIAIE